MRAGVIGVFAAAVFAAAIGGSARAQPVDPTGTPPPPKVQDPYPLLPPTPAVPEWGFGLEARSPIIKGEPASFNPMMGLGVGAHISRLFRSWFRLRFAVDHDRIFSHGQLAVPGLGGITVTRSQDLTSTAFLVEPMFRFERSWFSAHFLVGVGAYLAFFNNAEVDESKKVDRTALMPGARLEAGFSFKVYKSVEVGAAFGYDFRRDWTRVPVSTGASTSQRRVFDDQMGIAVRFDYLF